MNKEIKTFDSTWRKRFIISSIVIAVIIISFILYTFYNNAYKKGFDDGYFQGANDGSVNTLYDICLDGAITVQNNMTTKIVPLEEACSFFSGVKE